MARSELSRAVGNSLPGSPTAENFRLEEQPVPVLEDGQILLRTLYLSLDPYMRGRMSDAPSYAPPVAIDAVMVGGTVARVHRSKLAGFGEGDWVFLHVPSIERHGPPIAIHPYKLLLMLELPRSPRFQL